MGRQVIRTRNFAVDAAGFILDQAHNALGERDEFRIALSGGNLVPVYPRLAAIGHDLPWELSESHSQTSAACPFPGRRGEAR